MAVVLAAGSLAACAVDRGILPVGEGPPADAPAGFAQAIDAADPRVGIGGRAQSDGRSVRFDWPGSRVELSLSGDAVAVELEDEGRGNHFNVFVDGVFRQRWKLRPGHHPYTIDGLGAGVHHVVVAKRTEVFQGVTTVVRVWLRGDGLLRPAPARPDRRLEVVGASWVSGYGNEGDTYESCPNLEEVTNNWEAFGAITARRLNADYHVVAVHGQGVVRNAGDPAPLSEEPFPLQYGRLLWNDRGSRWDYSRWTPQAVVVDLGLNDHSTEPRPPSDVFQAGYAAFLRRLRGQYPAAYIFCVNITGWPHFSALTRSVVEDLQRAGDGRISFTPIPSFPLGEMGCDWHPRVAGHHAIADVLAPVIGSTLGWDVRPSAE